MDRWTISTGSKFEEMAGYSRAVVTGDWIFLSGTAGYDFATHDIAPDAAAQTRQCLANIAHALAQADATLRDILCVRVFLADRADAIAVSEILGATFHDPRPTNTTVVCGFAMPEMKVEIEVIARRPAPPHRP